MEIKKTQSLYHRYPGQCCSQPTYIELRLTDDEPVLRAGWCGEIGPTVPWYMYHALAVRWCISALRTDAADDLLAEIAPLCEQIASGYTSEWDGSNYRGTYTGVAQEAIVAVDAMIESFYSDDNCLNIMECAEYMTPCGSLAQQAAELGITAKTTDNQLCKIIEDLETDAANNGVDVLEGAHQYARDLRDHFLDACEAEQIAAM